MKRLLFVLLNFTCLTGVAQDLSIFKDIHYYRDIKDITQLLNDSSSEMYFERVVKKYIESPKSFKSDEQKIMLLYSGIFLQGYQNEHLDSLEDLAETFLDSGFIDKSIKLSKKCLTIFPVSVKANYILWNAYEDKNMKDSSNYYFDRLNVMLLAMMDTGYLGDKKQPTLAYDDNSIETYLGTVVVGREYLDKKYTDRKGNTIIIYRHGIGNPIFIIPKK